MITNKTIYALLVDYYDLLPKDQFYQNYGNSIVISHASTFESAQALRDSLIFDIVFIEQASYKKNRRQLSNFQRSFEGVTIILGRKIESFQKKKLHEFYFLNDSNYVIRPISFIEIKQRVSDKKPTRHPIFNSNKFLFTNALVEKITMHGAHEFNTPMNGILGVLNLMKEDFELLDEGDRKELLNAAISSCLRLKRTCMNLVLSVRGFQNSPHFSFRNQTNIHTALNKKIAEFISEKEIFRYEIKVEAANLPIAEEHFLLMLHECIDNAIKFGDPSLGFNIEGEVTSKHDLYLLTIRDYGQCNNYDFIDSFDAFVQLDRTRNEQQGWGLGLFLISQIANLYNIKWSIQPCLPGTAVEFYIPLNQKRS